MKILGFLLIMTLFFSSCGTPANSEELKAQLSDLESRLAETGRPLPAQLDTLVTLYEQLVAAVPGDTENNIRYLLKAAEASRTNFKFQQALDLYDRVLKEFPNHQNAPQALFMKGFIFENDMQNQDSALEVYNRFIQNYPGHELADDAQFLIDNLGKSDEEIIREFEAKQKKQE